MKYRVTLNNKVYEVEVEKGEAILKDEYEVTAPVAAEVKVESVPQSAAPQAPKAAVSAAPKAASGKVVKSPLPGAVVAVKVIQNQSVKKGEVLVVVEAMKMENEITAPFDGVIKNILVTKGSQVATSAPLIEME